MTQEESHTSEQRQFWQMEKRKKENEKIEEETKPASKTMFENKNKLSSRNDVNSDCCQ